MRSSLIIREISPDSILKMHFTDSEQNIRQICKLSANSSAFTSDTLYVSSLQTYCELSCSKSHSLFILVCPNQDIKLTTALLPPNYILCDGSVSTNDMYVRMMKLLSTSERVTEAELTISHALFDCTSVTDILEIASHLLGNPVLLQDFTTKLLAHSSIDTITVDDEILDSVFRNGYVTADLFQKYDYDNALEMIRLTPQTFLLESTKKADRLICQLTIRHQYFGWFLTVAYNQPFQEGDIEIMNFLAGALTIFLEKENILPNTSRSESLLSELLEPNHNYTDELFAKRASGFSWNLGNRFYVATIEESPVSDALQHNIMAYKNHLSMIFPSAKILERKRQLVLLFDCQRIQSVQKQILLFLQKYQLHAAFSDEFTHITEFASIYRQMQVILRLGARLNPTESIHYFHCYAIYYAITKLASADNIRYYCMPQLIEVCRYDREYHTEFAQSRRLCLELGSTGAAATHLNIHRNTMDYRLKKFNEIAGISNYTPMVIEHLMLSYKILDLYPELVEE